MLRPSASSRLVCTDFWLRLSTFDGSEQDASPPVLKPDLDGARRELKPLSQQGSQHLRRACGRCRVIWDRKMEEVR